MDALAAELGMSKKTLYVHFAGKDEIIGALIGGFAAEAAGIDGMLIATMALLIVALAPLARLRHSEEELGAVPT